jgi:hypothetical protein
MPANLAQSERRSLPRFEGRNMEVGLRQRGRFTRSSATVIDFNRHGVALLSREPLQKEKQIFLSLRCGEVFLDNVIGVVHNCIPQADGYRCGIQFRTRSNLQFDKDHVEHALRLLEAGFGYGGEDVTAANETGSAAH